MGLLSLNVFQQADLSISLQSLQPMFVKIYDTLISGEQVLYFLVEILYLYISHCFDCCCVL